MKATIFKTVVRALILFVIVGGLYLLANELYLNRYLPGDRLGKFSRPVGQGNLVVWRSDSFLDSTTSVFIEDPVARQHLVLIGVFAEAGPEFLKSVSWSTDGSLLVVVSKKTVRSGDTETQYVAYDFHDHQKMDGDAIDAVRKSGGLGPNILGRAQLKPVRARDLIPYSQLSLMGNV